MDIFLYAKQMAGPGEKLRRSLEVLVGTEEIEVFTTITDLAKRIYPFGHENRTVIFLASTRQELLEIFSISNLLRRLRSILVLPDRNPDTLKLGYLLEPRFISYVDSSFFEIQAMIEQMLKKTTKEYVNCGDNQNWQKQRSLLFANGHGESPDRQWVRSFGSLMAL